MGAIAWQRTTATIAKSTQRRAIQSLRIFEITRWYAFMLAFPSARTVRC